MKKQAKRTLALLLVLGTLLPMVLVSVQASTNQSRYIGTCMIATDLDIRTVGGTIGYAECIGYAELYSGYHATLVMELQQAGTTGAAAAAQNTLKIRYVCIVLAAVPIFCITPFVQKYLVAGTMLGAVKG